MTVSRRLSKKNASGEMRASREESARSPRVATVKANDARTFVADLVRTSDVYSKARARPREIRAFPVRRT